MSKEFEDNKIRFRDLYKRSDEIEERIDNQDKWIVDLYKCMSGLANKYHKLKREIRALKKEVSEQ